MENEQGNIKRSLVLAGGGVRLAYHAGVLIALEEEGLHFTHVDGTSGGIFGTAMLASGITPGDAAARWRNLKLKGFMSALPLKDYRSQRSLPAVGSAKGIKEKIFPSLGIDEKKINTNTTFDATFNVCNFSKKTIESISNKDVTVDHLIAGMSLPIFMPAVKINGDWYTDAVWIKDANLIEAVKRGAEEIWLVWCIGNTAEYLNGVFNQYVHMIEISANGGLFAEIDWLYQTNRERQNKGLQSIKLHIIKPDYPLPLDPDFFLGKITADTLINMGYADAKEYLKYKNAFNLADISKATAMKTPGITLHFTQQFEGKATLNKKIYSIIIQLSFFIREINNSYVLQQFSSVVLDKKNTISCYDNNVIVVGKGVVKSFLVFEFNKQQYKIQLEIYFHGVTDFLIGLDAKKARVIISGHEMKDAAYVFYQKTINRLKNIFHLNINANVSLLSKQKLKYKTLGYLFN
ncbi:MAG TPA: patatin-like phospholipase family protein [Chitinophagaceae bacterium]